MPEITRMFVWWWWDVQRAKIMMPDMAAMSPQHPYNFCTGGIVAGRALWGRALFVHAHLLS